MSQQSYDCSAWQYDIRHEIQCGTCGHGEIDLVLIHEMGGQIASWHGLAAILATHFRMLAYDQRASESSVAGHAADLTMLAEDVALRRPYWLVASAAGSAIALTHAAEYPDRVAGIVMLAPAIDVDDARRAYLESRALTALEEGMEAVVDSSLNRSYPTIVRRDPNVFAEYRKRMLASSAEAYASANRLLARMNIADILPNVQCPCLVLAGTHDLMRPPLEVRRFAATLPHAEYGEVDSAHLMAVQTPDMVAEQVFRFIDNHVEKPLPNPVTNPESDPSSASTISISATPAILMVAMEAPASLEEEFNDWYDTEHFPQRSALPGVSASSRWVCLAGWPRWMALYELSHAGVLESDAYRAMSGPNATPWSKRILPRTIGRTRVVAEQRLGSATADPSPLTTHIARLLVMRFPVTNRPSDRGNAEANVTDMGERIETAVRERLSQRPDFMQVRLFQEPQTDASSYWLMAAFDTPLEMADLIKVVGRPAGFAPQTFNLYAPYQRGG